MAHRRARVGTQAQQQFARGARGLRQQLALEHLRAGVEVKALELQARRFQGLQQRRHLFGVHANGLAPPPMRMPAPRSSKSGFTRTATRAGKAMACTGLGQQGHFAERLHIHQHPSRHGGIQLTARLPGPAKLMLAGAAPAASAR